MRIDLQIFTVHKRFALTISRGTTAQTTNVWLRIEQDGVEGWGEASPFSVGGQPQTTEAIVRALQQVAPLLEPFSPWQRQQIETVVAGRLPSAAYAALDLALHDWMGKQVGVPLWQMWGLDRDRIVPTSVTIGLSSPDVAQQRVRDWLDLTHAQAFKVKLGSPQGIEADQAMLEAVLEAVPPGAKVSVDANGGWSLPDAVYLCHWLQDQGVTYVEQPLARGQESLLPQLYQQSPLPIFVDESCFTSQDVGRLCDRVHGINIKLMKSGGLTEALRMIHTARASGLQVMFGCYSDSALLNTALAHLAPLADHLDLDSHLNLVDDPFSGAEWREGRVIPGDRPGLGVEQRQATHP